MEYVDLSEEQITKKQHYVPKAYLRNFAFDEQKIPHVYAIFPNGKEARSVSIDKICCQHYLYEQIAIDSDSGAYIFAAPNEIEDMFSKIESRYVAIVSRLKVDLQEKDDFALTSEEIGTLRGFLSLLLLRHPIFIHIVNCVVDRQYAKNMEYVEHLQNILPDVPTNVAIANLAAELMKRYLLISTLAMAKSMKDSKLCIFRSTEPVFVTSDMPVVNIYGEKNGIQYDLLGMPITPELFVAFIDVEYDIPSVLLVDSHSVMRINRRQQKAKSLLISNRRELLSFIDFSIIEEDEGNDEGVFVRVAGLNEEMMLKEYHEIMNSEKINYWI